MNRTLLFAKFLLVAAFLLPTIAEAQQPFGGCWHPDYVKTWTPESDPDAKFNRSTVALQPRITETNANAVKANTAQFVDGQVAACLTMNPMCSQCPSQGADNFIGYNPTYWQYMDILIWWGGSAGEGIIIPPSAPVTDVAHLHGVKVLGQVFFPPTTFGGNGAWVDQMLTKEGSTYPYARKMADIAHYYGFDGWFINEETKFAVGDWPNWCADYMAYCNEQGYENQELQWYNTKTTISSIVQKDNVSMFLNYGSPNSSNISSTKSTITGWGFTTEQYFHKAYFGIEVAQNGLEGNRDYYLNLFPSGGHAGSIDLFNPEEHTWKDYTKNLLGTSNDCGTQAYAAMNTSFSKESRYWVNEKGNPSTLNGRAGSYFPGLAEAIVERSTINSLPFVSSFSHGLGKHRFVNGENKGTQDWYHRGMQDVLPTWRWWQSGSGLSFSPYWDDAYNMGTSIKVSGNSSNNNIVYLYKTQLPISSGCKFQLVVKGTDLSNITVKLATSGTGLANSMTYTDFSNWTTTNQNGWTVGTIDLSSLAGSTVKAIALSFKGGAYTAYLGQIGILPDNYTPTQNAVTNVTVQNELTSTGGDIRVVWDAPADASQVHHYNVYMERGGVKTLVGQTRDEGFYIPKFTRNGLTETEVKVFISTVTKDLKESSTQVEQIVSYPTLDLSEITLKASKTLVNTNEEITITAKATNFPTAYEWVLPTNCTKVSQTGNQVVVKFTAEGYYDITSKVTNNKGTATKTESEFICVNAQKVTDLSPVSVGKKIIDYSSYMVGSGESPDYLIDGTTVPGSMNAKWCAGGAKEHFSTIDLQGFYETFRFVTYDCGNKENASDNLQYYKVLLSLDNVNWVEATNETEIPATAAYNVKDVYIKPQVARYVKFVPYHPEMPITIRIWEFQVHGISAAGNVTITAPADQVINLGSSENIIVPYSLGGDAEDNLRVEVACSDSEAAVVENVNIDKANSQITFTIKGNKESRTNTCNIILYNGKTIASASFSAKVKDLSAINLAEGKEVSYYDWYNSGWYYDGKTSSVTDGDLSTSCSNRTYTTNNPNLKWDFSLDASPEHGIGKFKIYTDGKETTLYIYINDNLVATLPGNASGEYVAEVSAAGGKSGISGTNISIRTYGPNNTNFAMKEIEVYEYDWTVGLKQPSAVVPESVVWPNPVSCGGKLNIYFPDVESVCITTLQGTIVLNEKIPALESSVSVPNINPGTYMITLKSKNGEVKTNKIVVKR